MAILSEAALDFAKEHIERYYDSDFFPKSAEFQALWYQWDEVKKELMSKNVSKIWVTPPRAMTIAKPKGGFSLASRESLLKGGLNAETAIVPGNVKESHLLRYVSDQVEDLEMPPLNKREKFPALTREEIEQLRRWIDAGAPWSEPGPITQN